MRFSLLLDEGEEITEEIKDSHSPSIPTPEAKRAISKRKPPVYLVFLWIKRSDSYGCYTFILLEFRTLDEQAYINFPRITSKI